MSPNSIALTFEGSTCTFQDLALTCRRLAHALRELGVQRNDRVAYLGPNHPAALHTLFACGLIGAVAVPVNARLSSAEVDFILRDSSARVVLHGPECTTTLDELPPATRQGLHTVCVEAPDQPAAVEYSALLDAAGSGFLDEPVGQDDLCLLMYTSGTTGQPKGVMLTHANMTWNAVNQIIGQDITSREQTLVVAPLFHIGGLGGNLTATLMQGGSLHLARGFDAQAVLASVENERITTFFAVPTMIDMLARHPRFAHTDLSSLRMICVAGAPVPESVIRPWSARGVAIQQAYGMTETAPSGTMLGSKDASGHVGSAGKMCFFTDVRIVDDADQPITSGDPGHVQLAGPNVMAGYWNRPEATAEAIHGGWMRTGDIGAMDADGFLYIRDRAKDMFISGGENVYPAEVESALLAHCDLVEAAVVGVADSCWGESGVAFVVSETTTAADVLAALEGKLARFKIPRRIEFVHALPRNGAGKVDKAALRERLAGSPRTVNASSSAAVVDAVPRGGWAP